MWPESAKKRTSGPKNKDQQPSTHVLNAASAHIHFKAAKTEPYSEVP